MITELEIENFKAFGAMQRARLARITLIYGANSSGKTTLIQSLLLLKQSMELSRRGLGFRVIPRGPFVDLGDSQVWIHRRIPNARANIRLGFSLSEDELTETPAVATASIAVWFSRSERIEQVEYAPLGWRPWRIQAGSDSGRVADAESAESLVEHLRYVETRQERGVRRIPEPPATDFSLLLERLRDSRIGLWASEWLPDTLSNVNSHASRGLRQLSNAFALRSVRHVGPVRAQPTRFQDGAYRPDLDEDTKGRSLYRQIAQLHKTPFEEKTLSKWIEQFDIHYEFKATDRGDDVAGELLVLHVTDKRTGLKVALPDIGYGISQLLPIVVLGIAEAGSNIAVEQPELHLHPRQQGHLADFMNESIPYVDPDLIGPEDNEPPARPTQWIVETHSEALVSRFQRRIREGKLTPKDISVLFVEHRQEGAHLRELRLDDRGELIDKWPGGFFEETYWDLFEGTQ